MNFKEKTIQKKNIYKGRLLRFDILQVKLPDGKRSKREIVSHPGAVAIIALLPPKKIILVKQYRKAAEKEMLEVPAGTLNINESPLACARRELEEETGYRARRLKKILTFYPSPGYSDEKIHLFQASGLGKTTQTLEADEFIKIEIVSLTKIKKLISSGKIKDGKTLIALSCLKTSSP